MKLLTLASTLLATTKLIAAAPRGVRRSPDGNKLTTADVMAFALDRSGNQGAQEEAVSMDEILGKSVNAPHRATKRADNKIHGGKQPPNHKKGGKKNPDDKNNGGKKHSDPKKGGNPNPGKNHGGKNEDRKHADEMNVDNNIHSGLFRGKKAFGCQDR